MTKSKMIIFTTLTFLGLNACVQNNDSEEKYSLVEDLENQSGSELANDIAGMGVLLQFANFGSAHAKTAVSGPPSSRDIEISFQPWSYNNSWWTRSGEISVTRDLGTGLLEGEDKVQFKNSEDAVVQFPIIESAVSAAIKRKAHLHLEGTRGAYWDVTRDWDVTAVLNISGSDTNLTINGSVEQNFSAENAAKTASIDLKSNAVAEDVVFNKKADGWGKPVSGTITAESDFKKIVVEFADSKANITVDGKNGNYHAEYNLTL